MLSYSRYLLIAAIILLLPVSNVRSADTLNTARGKLYFENLELKYPWTNTTNPAGLVFIENLKRVNLAELGYYLDKKNLKFPGEPGLANSYIAETKGLGRLGKLTYSGYFGYKNCHYNDLVYNNTLIFDPDNPYLLGDTVGGKQQKEGFILKGSIAYPVSSVLNIGISVDYQNFVGAKLKDPRNKNDISSLVVTPGITYKTGNFTVGLSGGPVITNNEVSVSVTEDAKYSLIQFLGLGYYKPILNIYSYSNTYYGKGFNSQAQVKFNWKNYFNLITASFNSVREEVHYGTSNRLTDGIADRKILSLTELLVFKNEKRSHRIDVSLNMLNINGTELMQHFETVVSGSFRYDTLITDKRTKGRHIVNNYSGSLEYSLTGHSSGSDSYIINSGIAGEYQVASHFPIQTNGSQEVMNLIPYAEFRKYMIYKSIILVPEIGVKYRMNLFRDKTYTITKWSDPEYQQLDYIARASDFIQGNAGFSLIKKTRFKNIPEYYLDLSASYIYFPEDMAGPDRNFLLNTSVGLIF